MKKKIVIPLLLFGIALSALFLGSCWTHYYHDHFDYVRTVSIKLTILPTNDTTSFITLATGQISYDVDSILKNSGGYTTPSFTKYNVSQMTTAKILSCSLLIDNALPAKNMANFSLCNADVYSDINAGPLSSNITNVSDLFSTELALNFSPSNDLKQYMITENKETEKTFYGSVKGTLRRPITDTLKCTLSITLDLHLEHYEKLRESILCRGCY